MTVKPAIELVRVLGTDSYRFVLVDPLCHQVAVGDDFVLYDATMLPGYKSVDVVRARLDDFQRCLGKKAQLTRATAEVIRNLARSL